MREKTARSIYLAGYDDDHQLVLEVVEITPYTALVNITPSKNNHYALGFSIQIRAYHDAEIAEVSRCEGLSKLLPKYDYPNSRMLHPDEKEQLNRFVREWLVHCEKHGRSTDIKWPWES